MEINNLFKQNPAIGMGGLTHKKGFGDKPSVFNFTCNLINVITTRPCAEVTLSKNMDQQHVTKRKRLFFLLQTGIKR